MSVKPAEDIEENPIISGKEEQILTIIATSGLSLEEMKKISSGLNSLIEKTEKEGKTTTNLPIHHDNKKRNTITLTNDIHRTIASSSNPSSFVSEKSRTGVKKSGIIKAAMRIKSFDTERCLGKLIFGGSFHFSIRLTGILATFYSLGTIIGFLAQWHVIPNVYTFACFMCIPNLVYMILNLNIDKVVYLFHEPNTYISMFWNLIATICMLSMSGTQENQIGFITAWIMTFISFNLLFFFE